MSGVAERYPREVDFVLDGELVGSALLEKLHRLRERAPIYWSEINQAWLVTGHHEVFQGYTGDLPLSNARLPFMAVAQVPPDDRERLYPNLMSAPKAWLLNLDGADHSRLRRLVFKAFSRPIVEALRPDVRRYIDEALDDVGRLEGSFDFIAEVARKIPARMILKKLGLDDKLIHRLHRWSNVMNSSGGANLSHEMLLEIDQVLVEMRQLFEPIWTERRKNPGQDFISALVTAEDGGHILSEDELFGICVIVLIAGHDTTANTIGLGVAEIARNHLVGEKLLAAPDPLNAIMELQRCVGMSTMMNRVVTRDFDWNGHQIGKGQFVLLFQLSANHDPEVFPNPDEYDPNRSQAENMTFAPGLHHCIGHLLAKMALTEFFPAFLQRFDVELADDRLNYAPSLSFRGLNSLHVRLLPKQAGPALNS